MCTDPACSQFPNRRAAGHLPKSSPGVLPALAGPEWSAELLVQWGLLPLVSSDRQLVQLWCLLVSFGRQFLLWCPWEPSRQFQQCPPPLLQTSHWTSWTIFRTISQGSGKDSPTMTKRFLTNFELSKKKLPESLEWVTWSRWEPHRSSHQLPLWCPSRLLTHWWARCLFNKVSDNVSPFLTAQCRYCFQLMAKTRELWKQG